MFCVSASGVLTFSGSKVQSGKKSSHFFPQEKFRREFKARIPCLRRLMGGSGGAGGDSQEGGGGVGGVGGAAVGANGATLAGATTVARSSVTMTTSGGAVVHTDVERSRGGSGDLDGGGGSGGDAGQATTRLLLPESSRNSRQDSDRSLKKKQRKYKFLTDKVSDRLGKLRQEFYSLAMSQYLRGLRTFSVVSLGENFFGN